MALALNVVLFEPEIPPNTGNVMRLCANTGCALHLIEPLGFKLDDARMRRAGLDYREFADVRVHANWNAFLEAIQPPRVFALSTRGARRYTEVAFADHDALLFGPETRGLPQDLLETIVPEQRLRIPMQPRSRSLNLSNAVAVIVFEALRQGGFDGLG